MSKLEADNGSIVSYRLGYISLLAALVGIIAGIVAHFSCTT